MAGVSAQGDEGSQVSAGVRPGLSADSSVCHLSFTRPRGTPKMVSFLQILKFTSTALGSGCGE